MDTLDLGQFIVLAAILAGVTELITRLRARDYWTVLTILSCVAVGTLFGLTHYYPNLDWAEGAAYGFAPPGVIAALGARKSMATRRPARR